MDIVAEQDGAIVFAWSGAEYPGITVVPAELLDNMLVASTVTVTVDGEVVSVVEPYVGG